MRARLFFVLAIASCTGAEGELDLPGEVPRPRAPSAIACTPETQLEFDWTAVGEESSRTAICRNGSSQPVTIMTTVRGDEFSIGVSERVLQPGGQVELAIRFAPRGAGLRSAFLDVETRRDGIVSRIRLTGEAVSISDAGCVASVNPRFLSYGVVDRGRRVSRNFRVDNDGLVPCRLQNVTARGEGITVIPPALPAWIGPGEDLLVQVEFEGAEGFVDVVVSGTLFEIPIFATRIEADLFLVPDELILEGVHGCSVHPRSIYIFNTSNVTARIQGFGFAGTFWSNDVLPETIEPGGVASFAVRYDPSVLGEVRGALDIHWTHADHSARVASATLIGRASPPPYETEIHRSPGLPRIDLLYVIDNSPSMIEEQNAVAANVDALNQYVMAQQYDAAVFYTTTLGDGVLTSTPAYGTSGSTISRGLLAIELAAPALRRPDTFFASIIISDNDDASPGLVDRYIDPLIANGSNLASVSAIVGPPGGCMGSGGTAVHGSRYIEAARQGGGVFESICDADWSTFLAGLSTGAFGFKSRYFLSKIPRPETIEVIVDGTLVPAFSPSGQAQWVYDQPTNSINFSPWTTPPPDVELRFTYALACD